jgi:hypothetical protein
MGDFRTIGAGVSGDFKLGVGGGFSFGAATDGMTACNYGTLNVGAGLNIEVKGLFPHTGDVVVSKGDISVLNGLSVDVKASAIVGAGVSIGGVRPEYNSANFSIGPQVGFSAGLSYGKTFNCQMDNKFYNDMKETRDGGFHGTGSSGKDGGGGGGGGGGKGGGGSGNTANSNNNRDRDPGTKGNHESHASKNGFPIVIDMDRDGKVELASKADGAFFDMDNDGLRDATGWVGKGDGLLVIDLGKGGTSGADGVIDQSSEVVFTNWLAGSTSDMAAVKAVFDSNKNGKLDAGDTRFGEFRIWLDKNGDGISQQGELKTLTELGIKEIDLTPSGKVVTQSDGSKVTGTSTVTFTDGSTTLAGDSSFAYTATGSGAEVVLNADGNVVSNTGEEILGNSGDNTLTGTSGDDRTNIEWRMAA